MAFRKSRLLVTLGLALASFAYFSDASGQEPAKAEDSQVRLELLQLGEEYKRVEDEQLRTLPPDGAADTDDALSDKEWLAKGREIESRMPGADAIMLPRILALAKKFPESPFALDALAFVIRRGGPQTGNVHGQPWQL
jgi:hypothetical protein